MPTQGHHRTQHRAQHASLERVGWLVACRVVMKGQKGIRLVAPDTIDDAGKLRSIKPVYVFDGTDPSPPPSRCRRAGSTVGAG